MAPAEIESTIVELEEEMLAAAEELRFEYAAKLRDEVRELVRSWMPPPVWASRRRAGSLRGVQRVSFRIPEDKREDVLDGVLSLLPSGSSSRWRRASPSCRRSAPRCPARDARDGRP